MHLYFSWLLYWLQHNSPLWSTDCPVPLAIALIQQGGQGICLGLCEALEPYHLMYRCFLNTLWLYLLL